jgi:tetratricopeptide (TPR) repeat protein
MLKYGHSFVLAALLAAGCASARTQPPAVAPDAAAEGVGAQAPAEALGPYIEATREISRRARPARPAALTVERWSAELGAAIEQHAAAPTAENTVRLAQVYWRLGILDDAYENFNAAARLDARQGPAWDGLARIWRDWGSPGIALGHAYRAISASPTSAASQNTLGTILLALGKGPDARRRFGLALALDPGAAYARNNLCYAWLMAGEPDRAEPECREAVVIDPGMQAARNNLALARAQAGDLVGAAALFGVVSGEAAAQYNLGIVFLSKQQYAAAAAAFDRAAALQPTLTLASARARQARKHAAEEHGKEDAGERR